MSNISKIKIKNADGTEKEYNVSDSNISTKIGDLDELITEDKSNLVNAINEVSENASGNNFVDVTLDEYNAMETHDPDTYYNVIDDVQDTSVILNQIGDITQLTTEEKSNLVGAINEVAGKGGDASISVINGIPVDLTGIYNGQMIGYDEESGKLLPMTSYKREIDLKDEYVDVIESGLYEYDPNGSSNFRIYFKKDDNETDTTLIFQFQNAFMFSEFSNFYIYFYNVGGNSRYDPNFYADIMLSKDENFETIDVTWHISASMDNYQNYSIVSLMGKYYIRIVLHSRRQYAGIYNLKLS